MGYNNTLAKYCDNYSIKEERKKRNNASNSGHYVCNAVCLQRRTGSARTSLRPIEKTGPTASNLAEQ
jgi:hypothetical protein